MKSDALAAAIQAGAVEAGEAAVCSHLAAMGLELVTLKAKPPPAAAKPAYYGKNVTIRSVNVTGVTAVVYVEARSDVPPPESWWLATAVSKLERICGVSAGMCGYHAQDWLLLKVE